MSSLNKACLIGNLGRDPETRRMSNGDPVVSFSLATTESWRDQASGERKERTEWHNVVIFNEGLAEIAGQYLKKGSKVYLEGQLQTRDFTDKDGNKRRTTEIVLQRFRGALVLLSGRGAGDDAPTDSSPGMSGYASKSDRDADTRRPLDTLDDDVPF